jgi:hypothetical protein
VAHIVASALSGSPRADKVTNSGDHILMHIWWQHADPLLKNVKVDQTRIHQCRYIEGKSYDSPSSNSAGSGKDPASRAAPVTSLARAITAPPPWTHPRRRLRRQAVCPGTRVQASPERSCRLQPRSRRRQIWRPAVPSQIGQDHGTVRQRQPASMTRSRVDNLRRYRFLIRQKPTAPPFPSPHSRGPLVSRSLT